MNLSKIGERIARAQDSELAERETASVGERAALLREAVAKRKRARIVRGFAWAAAAVVLVGVGAGALLRPKPPLAFRIDDRSAGETWVAANEAPVHVAFGDGSSLSVQPHAQMRILNVNADGANVALERGTLHADVVHRPSARWSVEAGPFEVRVTGTRFDATWDPSTEALSITMDHGEVVVSGPCVKDKVVATGEKAILKCAPAVVSIVDGMAPTTSPPAVALDDLPHASASSTARPTPPLPSVTWRDLLVLGDYAGALADAEKLGFGSVLAGASEKELMSLGDAARFEHRPSRAIEAFTEVRSRFPKTASAAIAAFHLGRLASQDARHRDALSWFETYRREQPSGAFAMEALGRIIEAHSALGESEEAKRSSREYLAAYPQGPHASLAGQLLSR